MAKTCRYSIDIRDANTKIQVLFTAFDLDEEECRVVLDQIDKWVVSKPGARRYSIEVAEFGRKVTQTVTDWDDDDKAAAFRQIARWSGVPEDMFGDCFLGPPAEEDNSAPPAPEGRRGKEDKPN